MLELETVNNLQKILEDINLDFKKYESLTLELQNNLNIIEATLRKCNEKFKEQIIEYFNDKTLKNIEFFKDLQLKNIIDFKFLLLLYPNNVEYAQKAVEENIINLFFVKDIDIINRFFEKKLFEKPWLINNEEFALKVIELDYKNYPLISQKFRENKEFLNKISIRNLQQINTHYKNTETTTKVPIKNQKPIQPHPEYIPPKQKNYNTYFLILLSIPIIYIIAQIIMNFFNNNHTIDLSSPTSNSNNSYLNVINPESDNLMLAKEFTKLIKSPREYEYISSAMNKF